MLVHGHATAIETTFASIGWTFLAAADQPIEVAIDVHVKYEVDVTYMTWMGDGGKPTDR